MTGALSVVLHAHLPYTPIRVGAFDPRECWLYEALLECYIPLTLELAALDVPGRLTVSVSPTLLAMLDDSAIFDRFGQYLTAHLDALNEATAGARFLVQRARSVQQEWQQIGGDLPSRWLQLHQAGRIELITCAGTHPVLPLLRSTQCRSLHIHAAIDQFEARFGHRPTLLWLPECGYSAGIDELLSDAKMWGTVVEARALGESSPPALRGKYAPVVSHNVAFFARDPQTSAAVWSAETGYPGHPAYREFHRTMGPSPVPLGLKAHRVSGAEVELADKLHWEPEPAFAQASEHAQELVALVERDFQKVSGELTQPHLLAAYDAELFGHWWYEGPTFLAELLRHAAGRFEMMSPSEFLETRPTLQVAQPAESSWGDGGDFSWWVDEATAWLIPLLHTAEERWLEALNANMDDASLAAATEQLMLAQASDWPFAIRGVTHAEYAKQRVHEHLERFHAIVEGAPFEPPQVFPHLQNTLQKPIPSHG